MDQQELWHDTIHDAIRAAVDALGGPKSVASELWPTKRLEDGRRYLLHCLDSERPEKLGMDELLLIGRKAREAGCHTIMHFLAQEWGYTIPTTVEPEDQMAELQREYIAMVKAQELLAKRMEKITLPSLKAVG